MRGAFVDPDGVVRLEARLDGLVDELAEPPACAWCALELVQTWSRGRTAWSRRHTGHQVCSGQVVGGWGALHVAMPVEWRVAT